MRKLAGTLHLTFCFVDAARSALKSGFDAVPALEWLDGSISVTAIRGLMKTFGLLVPSTKGGRFDEQVRRLLADNEALARIILPVLEAWRSVRLRAAELGRQILANARQSTNFAQVIEGEHDRVGVTMDRIRADPRHTDIQMVLDRGVLSRQFGDWAMRRADGGEVSTPGTTFLLGFALGERSVSAKRLYEIIIATEM